VISKTLAHRLSAALTALLLLQQLVLGERMACRDPVEGAYSGGTQGATTAHLPSGPAPDHADPCEHGRSSRNVPSAPHECVAMSACASVMLSTASVVALLLPSAAHVRSAPVTAWTSLAAAPETPPPKA
jgi:hypothetical protein